MNTRNDNKNTGHKAWLVLVLTMTIQAFGTMTLLIPPVLIPALSTEVGINTSHLGLYIAVAYLAAMTSSLGSGMMLTMTGPIRLSILCIASCAIGMLVFLLDPSLLTLLIMGLFIGAGYGPITPCSSQILIKNTPKQRLNLIFSIKQTGVPLGGVMAALIIPALLEVMSWYSALLVILIALIVFVCIALFTPKDWEPENTAVSTSFKEEFLSALKTVFSTPALRTLALCSLCFSICQLTLMTYAITFLNKELGFALVLAGFLLSFSQVSSVVGRILWGWLADRYFSPWSMLVSLCIGMILAAIAIFSIDATTSSIVIALFFILYGATGIGWNGVYLTEVARKSPEGKSGSITGVTLSVTYLGVVIGPPIVGMVSESSGSYGYGFLFLLIPLGAALLLLLGTRKAF